MKKQIQDFFKNSPHGATVINWYIRRGDETIWLKTAALGDDPNMRFLVRMADRDHRQITRDGSQWGLPFFDVLKALPVGKWGRALRENNLNHPLPLP